MSETLSTIVPDPAAKPKLALRNLTVVRRSAGGAEITAARDVSFDVQPGEFVCLLGPSGSGKTSVLNVLAGLEAPSSGQVLLDGQPITGPGPDRAVLFQEPALFPWLSVRGNVELALQFAGVARGGNGNRAGSWRRTARSGPETCDRLSVDKACPLSVPQGPRAR